MRVVPSLLVLALLAASSGAEGPPVRGILPVAGSTPGAFESHFGTSLQLHNRGASVARGILVFHPNGHPAQPGDPSLAYEIAPRQTVHFDDLVAAMETTGIGSIDLVTVEGQAPAAIARVFDEGAEGTEGMMVPLLDPRDALRPGIDGLLIAPPDFQQYRFNIGVRSLAEGASIRFTVFGANGIERFSIERNVAPDTLEQRPAAEMLGQPLLPDDSVSIQVRAGAALVYATTTDNVSNDPSLQTAAIVAAD